jgi:hypothetical protein
VERADGPRVLGDDLGGSNALGGMGRDPYHVSVVYDVGTWRPQSMTCLVVYYLDGKWYGEEATYKRSGSGFYREYTRMEIPQTREEIEKFAAERRYKIEWRGEVPGAATAAV